MEFEWDPEKAAGNLLKHGVSFSEAASVFLYSGALTFFDPDHSREEHREITIGTSVHHHILFVSHTARGNRIRIISSRKATRHERKQYEEGLGI